MAQLNKSELKVLNMIEIMIADMNYEISYKMKTIALNKKKSLRVTMSRGRTLSRLLQSTYLGHMTYTLMHPNY